MLGRHETSITYPIFVEQPATKDLYFSFRDGGAGRGDQYFYHYNAASATWAAAAGTGTDGIIIEGKSTPNSAYLDGLPKWSADGRELYWAWSLYDGSVISNKYLMFWDETSFHKFGGEPQAIPVNPANSIPVVDLSPLSTQTDFAIDRDGVVYIPFQAKDANDAYQVYVAESSTDSFVVRQVTRNVRASYATGIAPTMFMGADDYQYGTVYLPKNSPTLGHLFLIDWIPPLVDERQSRKRNTN